MKFDQSLTRRNALAVGAAAFGAAMTQSLTAADKDLPWIDAHSHIWPGEVDKFPLVPDRRKQTSSRRALRMTN